MVLELSKLNTIEEWGRQDKWDVRFRAGQGPEIFTDWLPATNLTKPVYNISSYDWSSGHRTLTIPKAIDYPDISMTLLDDDKRTIRNFLQAWANYMFPASGGIRYLSDIVKILDVSELNVQNEVVSTESYIVFPSGSVASSLTSEAGILNYSVSFKIVGYSKK
jgi:hypothetical protein